MTMLQLIRIEGQKETILEETLVPGDWDAVSVFHSPDHIANLEEHYRRTGKPKRSKIDVLYLVRRQVERE